ncbi:BRO-N domain-containing protein [Acetobacter sp. UBA5411]|mgnify:CR=1 FL=1|uniref:BRO-N domain-containing protein n=1 Tax=Acetobacter sp. UBA5411 TaxID=1945905 RepID=UPI0025C62AD2|nr:BRO family protein [Acetobacter sp. UBA5411]
MTEHVEASLTPIFHDFPVTSKDMVKVRTVDIEGRLMFVLTDVCSILGNRPDNLKSIFADGERQTHKVLTSRGPQNAVMVTESGLYKVILRAHRNTEVATRFQDWVTQSVLPTVRSRGAYVKGEEIINDPTVPDSVRAEVALQTVETLQQRVAELTQAAETFKAKAEAFDQIMNRASKNLSVRQVARRLSGVNLRLVMGTLVELGYLRKAAAGYSVPSQYRGRYFDETWSQFHGANTINVLPEGVALMERLYQRGKFQLVKRAVVRKVAKTKKE